MEKSQHTTAQDDQAWFDALRGKTEDGQGAMLRHMIRQVESAESAQENIEHDWQRLQFALRREQKQQGWRGELGVRYFALAASVLILAGTLVMLRPMGDEWLQTEPKAVGMMRGTAAQVIVSATAEQDAQQLEAELISLGVEVTRRAAAERIELHVVLTYPVTDEVRNALESRLVPVPEQDALDIVYVRP